MFSPSLVELNYFNSRLDFRSVILSSFEIEGVTVTGFLAESFLFGKKKHSSKLPKQEG